MCAVLRYYAYHQQYHTSPIQRNKMYAFCFVFNLNICTEKDRQYVDILNDLEECQNMWVTKQRNSHFNHVYFKYAYVVASVNFYGVMMRVDSGS